MPPVAPLIADRVRNYGADAIRVRGAGTVSGGESIGVVRRGEAVSGLAAELDRGLSRPGWIFHSAPSQRNDVRFPIAQDLLGVTRVRDQSHGNGRNTRLLTYSGSVSDMIAGNSGYEWERATSLDPS